MNDMTWTDAWENIRKLNLILLYFQAYLNEMQLECKYTAAVIFSFAYVNIIIVAST